MPDQKADVKRRNICANCRHFSAVVKTNGEDSEMGECLRFPPTMVVIENTPVTAFPVVSFEQVCGEHLR